MKWNLRLAAANRGIWKASELRRMPSDRGIEMSVGKLSGLWSGQPNVLRPDELDAFCAVLNCEISDLITAEPEKAPAPRLSTEERTAVGHVDMAGPTRMVTPKPKSGRSLPPRWPTSRPRHAEHAVARSSSCRVVAVAALGSTAIPASHRGSKHDGPHFGKGLLPAEVRYSERELFAMSAAADACSDLLRRHLIVWAGRCDDQQPGFGKCLAQVFRCVLDIEGRGIDREFGVGGFFVWVGDAGENGELACSGHGVLVFAAAFTLLESCRDVDEDERSGQRARPCGGSRPSIRCME